MPQPRTEMRRIREVLRLKFELGLSTAATAASARIARSTVKQYLDRLASTGLSYEQARAMDDADLDRRLFATPAVNSVDRPVPDWSGLERQLRGRGVTLKLLWLEYLADHPDGFRYTQFCERFHAWQQSSRPPTMRQQHRAGEALQVDYAGMTLTVRDAGTERQAQVFVACLPCSNLIYAEASWTQGIEDWLAAHVRTFAFLGGVPARLVPDNLKAGVTAASFYDPVLNRSYHELARHYDTVVVPTRVRRPRDKADVEQAVKLVEQWVLAPLRHRQLFSLAEANTALRAQVDALNDRPFAPPAEGSRRTLFEAIERAALKPLPVAPFVIGRWLTARVTLDYHIAVDSHYYSVPHRLVHKRVEVFLTPTAVTVFHAGERVATHARSTAKAQHTTLVAHMPPAHQVLAQRTPERLRQQAAALGVATAAYVDRLLTGCEHPEQGLRRSLGIVRLAARFGAEPVDAACRRALAAGALSTRYVEQVLRAGEPPATPSGPEDGVGDHGNVRGPRYYH